MCRIKVKNLLIEVKKSYETVIIKFWDWHTVFQNWTEIIKFCLLCLINWIWLKVDTNLKRRSLWRLSGTVWLWRHLRSARSLWRNRLYRRRGSWEPKRYSCRQTSPPNSPCSLSYRRRCILRHWFEEKKPYSIITKMTFKILANENWPIFEWLFTLLKIETKLKSNRFLESLEVVFSPRDGPWSCAGGNHRTLTVGISPRFSSRLTFCGASSSGGNNVTINTVRDRPCTWTTH